MKKSFVPVLCIGAALIACAMTPLAHAHEEGTHTTQSAGVESKPGPKLETLMKHALERVKGTEVIVSRVTIPANTTLPKHWHPGEEFAYVIEGTVTLWLEGKEDIIVKAGDAARVPLEQVHTAITKDEPVTLLVFRVHEQGKPERVLVKEDDR